jgi:hypothetical protein
MKKYMWQILMNRVEFVYNIDIDIDSNSILIIYSISGRLV